MCCIVIGFSAGVCLFAMFVLADSLLIWEFVYYSCCVCCCLSVVCYFDCGLIDLLVEIFGGLCYCLIVGIQVCYDLWFDALVLRCGGIYLC